MEKSDLSIEERIRAFYKQSGGPLNPRIPELIERHLLYGKDHGPPGRRETLADAIMRWLMEDPSMRLVAEWYMRRQMRQNSLEKRLGQVEKELGALREEVRELRRAFLELCKERPGK